MSNFRSESQIFIENEKINLIEIKISPKIIVVVFNIDKKSIFLTKSC